MIFHPIATPVLKGLWTVRGEEMIFIRLVLSKTHDFFFMFSTIDSRLSDGLKLGKSRFIS